MKILNRSQVVVLLLMLLLTLLLGFSPPWRYSTGEFAGFHPLTSPPPALPDSSNVDNPVIEYLPIKIIPVSFYSVEKRSDVQEDALRQPFVDIRRMMGVGALLFILTIVALIALGRSSPARKDASSA